MIDAEVALDIARQRAQQKGWPFLDPVQLIQRRTWSGKPLCFEIETNVGQRGCNARFTVDAATGGIVSEGFNPR